MVSYDRIENSWHLQMFDPRTCFPHDSLTEPSYVPNKETEGQRGEATLYLASCWVSEIGDKIPISRDTQQLLG